MPVGESLFHVFPCPFPFSCCQHLFRSSVFFADSFYWCSFSVFFYLFPLSCFLFFSLLFPFLRSPFLSSPFSALSFSPSCFFLPLFPLFRFRLPVFFFPFFRSFVFAFLFFFFSSPFSVSPLSLPAAFPFFCHWEATSSKKTETTERKKRSDGRQKRKRRATKNRSDGRQKTEEMGRKR